MGEHAVARHRDHRDVGDRDVAGLQRDVRRGRRSGTGTAAAAARAEAGKREHGEARGGEVGEHCDVRAARDPVAIPHRANVPPRHRVTYFGVYTVVSGGSLASLALTASTRAKNARKFSPSTFLTCASLWPRRSSSSDSLG